MDLTTIEAVLRPQDRASMAGWEPGDSWLAGGTWLFSEPQPTLRRLVDLAALNWPALEVMADGLRVGATCTMAELSRFVGPPAWTGTPLFAQCCHALLGSFKVWNAATVGGNICLGLPAGSMTALTATFDGVATIWTPEGDERTVAIADLVVGAGRTTLAPGELLRSVWLPATALRSHTAMRQVSLSTYGRSAVLVIGRCSRDDSSVVVTITASTVRPVQLRFDSVPTTAAARAALVAAAPAYHDDVHGDPRWREAQTATALDDVVAELATGGGAR